jgi:hypothetical protein
MGNVGNCNFAEERTTGNRIGKRNFTAQERITRTRGYTGDRMYAGRDRLAETRGLNGNRTFGRDPFGETNRIYATAGYGNTTSGGYGRTWRGDRFVGGVAAGVVAAGVGLNYGYPGYGYNEYQGYGSGYPGYGSAYGYPGYAYGSTTASAWAPADFTPSHHVITSSRP